MDSGYGITKEGINIKTFDILIEDLQNKLKLQDSFGDDIDFSDQDPLKQFSIPIIELLTELWELGQQVFYSASPKYAEGVPLRNTGKYIGISGKQINKAKGVEKFIGSPGTFIPINFQVKTSTNIIFQTIETKMIPASGEININIEALVGGQEGNVPSGTITSIVRPIIGLTSVTNISATTGGQDEETDTQFRDRYEQSVSLGEGSTIDAIRANVLTVTGVTDVVVTENDTDSTVNSIPPHAFETLVKGGSDTDVAQSIFDKKPAGTRAYGTTSANITDSQGIIHSIGFTRPTNKNIWIKIDITTDSNYPADGETQIKTAVKSYIDNIKLGEDIIIYKLITIVSNLQLKGLNDMVITLSEDGTTYSSNNITINDRSIAVTDLNKIEVI